LTETAPRSPQIERLSWGRIEVAGHGTFKDVKLFPGGAREWDWRETGTRHSPGIQPADVEELLAHGARVVVLSRGMLTRLGIGRDTLRQLDAQGVPAHVLPTKKAVAVYNELAEAEPVGGLFHTTC
jgi:hypothetical protein